MSLTIESVLQLLSPEQLGELRERLKPKYNIILETHIDDDLKIFGWSERSCYVVGSANNDEELYSSVKRAIYEQDGTFYDPDDVEEEDKVYSCECMTTGNEYITIDKAVEHFVKEGHYCANECALFLDD